MIIAPRPSPWRHVKAVMLVAEREDVATRRRGHPRPARAGPATETPLAAGRPKRYSKAGPPLVGRR